MKITNRLFTYPVLSEEKDDFPNSSFIVDFQYAMQGASSIKLSFDISMTCPEIEQLILRGDAEYVIHLECSTTAYREVLKTVSQTIETTISIGRINGFLEIVAFVVLKKNISHYSCDEWMDDYEGMSFNLMAGSILAYHNLQGLDITKDYEEFANANSIFVVYKRITEDDMPAEINMETSKIRIGLSTKDYDVYSLYSQKLELQSVFNSMLIFPALVFVFEELQNDIDTYRDKGWFVSLEKAYEKRGLCLEDELNSEKFSFQLAQEAMELPLSQAFRQVPFLLDTNEEDAE